MQRAASCAESLRSSVFSLDTTVLSSSHAARGVVRYVPISFMFIVSIFCTHLLRAGRGAAEEVSLDASAHARNRDRLLRARADEERLGQVYVDMRGGEWGGGSRRER